LLSMTHPEEVTAFMSEVLNHDSHG